MQADAPCLERLHAGRPCLPSELGDRHLAPAACRRLQQRGAHGQVARRLHAAGQRQGPCRGRRAGQLPQLPLPVALPGLAPTVALCPLLSPTARSPDAPGVLIRGHALQWRPAALLHHSVRSVAWASTRCRRLGRRRLCCHRHHGIRLGVGSVCGCCSARLARHECLRHAGAGGGLAASGVAQAEETEQLVFYAGSATLLLCR